MNKRHTPEINAGSMADIAFLLLIFFLVTTTMDTDSGILKKLPPKEKNAPQIVIHDRNILEVKINQHNELMFDNRIIGPDEIKEITLNFIDNGGGLDIDKQPCTWCKGKKDKASSDHPSKAFISIQANRSSSYETYITVMDEINKAYASLRNRVSVDMYGQNYSSLLENLKANPENGEEIMAKIKAVRSKYPLLVADTEMSN
ncbi:biopolymer transporter ExbD [Flavobacteriaceae bacterium S356]|uniref:Biopolymer transporter ExbD n=1 Tax=Asprobacillus argus TaxID=3076534 RepID=A0ABU3LEV7_9FLAO|nr:biopolymer transporter ExbD [Flavobacteriaceae bacterium S356]